MNLRSKNGAVDFRSSKHRRRYLDVNNLILWFFVGKNPTITSCTPIFVLFPKYIVNQEPYVVFLVK